MCSPRYGPATRSAGLTTEPSNWRDMWEPSSGRRPATYSQSSAPRTIEMRCAVLSLSAAPRGKYGCGRYVGTSVKPGTGPALIDKLPGRGVQSLNLGMNPNGGVRPTTAQWARFLAACDALRTGQAESA